MRLAEPLRLALLGIAVLILQLALIASLPGWRTGFELYAIFILLLAATRGPLLAGVYALAGGAVMDAYSNVFIVFHILFYLVPVGLGSLIRSQVLTEYRLLGSSAVVGLLLLKVLAMLGAAYAIGAVPSLSYLFRTNYVPILACGVVVYAAWPWLNRLMGAGTEVRVVGR